MRLLAEVPGGRRAHVVMSPLARQPHLFTAQIALSRRGLVVCIFPIHRSRNLLFPVVPRGIFEISESTKQSTDHLDRALPAEAREEPIRIGDVLADLCS